MYNSGLSLVQTIINHVLLYELLCMNGNRVTKNKASVGFQILHVGFNFLDGGKGKKKRLFEVECVFVIVNCQSN